MRGLHKLIVLCYFIFPLSILGQNYVNNPYSRYAIGDLINTGLSYNRSMGGSSVALRPLNQINYLNPASYTSQDTMSFLFQGGITARNSLISTTMGEDKTTNANLEYLVLGFPITKWWKFSVGLVPYSRINYLFREYPYDDDENNYLAIDYKGNGGFNEFYFGTSYEIKNFLSIGLNACYLFGSLDKERIIDNVNGDVASTNPDEIIAYTQITEEYKASDFYLRLGLQTYKTFASKHTVIIGVTFDGRTKIKVKKNSLSSRGFFKSGLIYVDTFNVVNNSAETFTMPMKFGLGVSYKYDNKLLITTEISQQDFTKSTINDHENLSKYFSLRFGIEYTPVPMIVRKRASYIARMHYRIGAHYTDTYLNIAGTQITDYGFSVGLGLPWRNPSKLYTYSSFNISYEYGVRGTTANGLLRENYHIITLGFTLHDYWFHKAKYD